MKNHALLARAALFALLFISLLNAPAHAQKEAASPLPQAKTAAAVVPAITEPKPGTGEIDVERARSLLRKSQRGEKLTPAEQTYLDKARLQRQKSKGKNASPPDAPPGKTAAGIPGRTVTDLMPLTEMTAKDQYKGEDGGLYGGGKNEPPEAHLAAARKELAKIIPLDAEGKPATGGKVVLLSIGMSNTSQEFSTFKNIADADAQKAPHLVIVDGAQHSRNALDWATGRGRGQDVWPELNNRLKQAGMTPQQVQVVWLKHDIQDKKRTGLDDARTLQGLLMTILSRAKTTFPNLRVAYLSSRIYQGYSQTRHPEPEPYETAFAVRWVIQDQIKGRPELNYDPARGEVKAPFVLWGPYLWANGTKPRKSDGLVWERQDFQAEGDPVHPSPSGGKKVAGLLLEFFKTDPLAKTWFLAK